MNKEVEEAKEYYKYIVSLAERLDEVIINGRIEPLKKILNYIQELEEDNKIIADLKDVQQKICNEELVDISYVDNNFIPKQKLQEIVNAAKNDVNNDVDLSTLCLDIIFNLEIEASVNPKKTIKKENN